MSHHVTVLGDETRRLFGDEGWHTFPGLLAPAQVVSINEWLTAAVARAEKTPSLEPEFEPSSAGCPGTVRKLRRLFWNDQAFWSSVLAGPFAQLSIELVGPGACLVFHAAFLKGAAGGSATPFHQDPAFWRYSYPGAVSMWLALDPADESNGCMKVCSGSHRLPILPHRRRDDWVHPGIDLKDHGLKANPVVMQPGDVLAWDKNLIHGSSANQSPNRRWGIVAVIADGHASNFRAFESVSFAPLAVIH